MKTVKMLASMLALALIVVAPMQALAYQSVSRFNGTSGSGEWITVNGDIQNYIYIGATLSKDGVDVYVSDCDYNLVTEVSSCQFGSLFTTDKSVFTVNKLNSATLAPVSVELFDDSWNPVGPVVVEANLTGVGPTQKGNNKVQETYDGLKISYKGQYTYRNALVNSVLDGNDLGETSYGGLVQFKSMYSQKSK